MGLYQSFLPLSPLSPLFLLSLSLLRLISSDDDVIRPSHVTLNCSIISQLLSQPITFAVVLEASVLEPTPDITSGIFTDRARGSWTGKYARLLSSRVTAIDIYLLPERYYDTIFVPWIQSRLSLVCLLTIVESYKRKNAYRALGKTGRYVTLCCYNFLQFFLLSSLHLFQTAVLRNEYTEIYI